MVEGGSGRSNRRGNAPAIGCSGRRRRLVKPADWPRYMVAKPLAKGQHAYYWRPPQRDVKAGCLVHSEPLGKDYGQAIARSEFLNSNLDAWRAGRYCRKDERLHQSFGTVDWWIDRYLKSIAYANLGNRQKRDNKARLERIADLSTKTGGRVGSLPVASITTLAVDRMYSRLLTGNNGPRPRQANLEMDTGRRAWFVVSRLYPDVFPASNPFVGIERVATNGTIVPTTREEAYALAGRRKLGHPHQGAAALICFEWLQRPENVLSGAICWTDYRPRAQPHSVRIEHYKTGAIVWHDLEDEEGPFYPAIEAYLSELEQLGIPIVLTPGTRGKTRPYSFYYARSVVRKARRKVGLGEHVTLTACRHGGMTELGNASLTEAQIMSLSGHTTPSAARGYVKRTQEQRLAASRARRAWIYENETGVRVGMRTANESE